MDTCSGYSCDAWIEWYGASTSCSDLESAGCDCSGCSLCDASPPSSPSNCLDTCYGQSCDDWGGACASIESQYFCDCSDCACESDNFDPFEAGSFSNTSSIQHVQWSVTKSWSSIIVGKLISDSLLDSEDATLGEIFRDEATWADIEFAMAKKAVTVKEILTMTSGFYDGGTGCCHQNSDSLKDALDVSFYSASKGSFAYTNPSLVACKFTLLSRMSLVGACVLIASCRQTLSKTVRTNHLSSTRYRQGCFQQSEFLRATSSGTQTPRGPRGSGLAFWRARGRWHRSGCYFFRTGGREVRRL